MKYFLLFLLALSLSANTYAQSKDDEAMALYQKAETAYEAANYSDAYNYINRVVALIGTNPKVLYLRIKILNTGINNNIWAADEHNYNLLIGYITDLFSKINKDTYPPEKYSEMVSLKIDVADKLKPFKDAREKMNVLKMKAQVYYTDLKKRRANFLKDTFNVYIQKFVKNFNDYNAAVYDPGAYTISTDENLQYVRKYLKKHPEVGPFPHHLAYNPATEEIYIYHYTPTADNKGISDCCPDTVNALDLNSYNDRRITFNGYKKFTNADKIPALQLFFHLAGQKYGKNELTFKSNIPILDSLFSLVRQTGFDAYYTQVFAFADGSDVHYFKWSTNGWGEYAYPFREPISKYDLLTYQSSDAEIFLYNTVNDTFIRFTRDECFTGKIPGGTNWKYMNGNTLTQSLHDKVTNKAHIGVWMTEIGLADGAK